jgi:hypothetical protein
MKGKCKIYNPKTNTMTRGIFCPWPNAVTVEMAAHKDDPFYVQKGARCLGLRSSDIEEVYNYIKANPGATYFDIVMCCNVDRRSAERMMKRFIKHGMVASVGKPARWSVNTSYMGLEKAAARHNLFL